MLLIAALLLPACQGSAFRNRPPSAEEQVAAFIERHQAATQASVQDGCLFRSLVVRQYFFGGQWSRPEYLPDPGYARGAYRFVQRSSWYTGHRLPEALEREGLDAERIVRDGCGRTYPHLDPGRPVYVRTPADATWEYGYVNTPPYLHFREIQIGCFAFSTLNQGCR